ncbi:MULTISPECIES: hypothetical protein [Thalassolituus]|jgi:hypothetical protein|uniref:Chalcone isomerase domain-containing protein n=1 Tax=Thalassolituus hydrocarboniclasticus TaxID=2742796 RepID=A0ABY6AAK1_9GAMM|nr:MULTISPECIES: hypothetical protein [Thalassolituus]UXD88036.1 hypothetical protein HUF19_11605 [Thalassolituus hydrocarboniclasticus]
MRSLLAVFAALIWSVHSQAAELQGVGIFQTLNKPWFLTALYTTEVSAADKSAVTEAPQPERLEFKVVEDKISAYRFRQLWQEAFAVVHGDDIWNTYAADLGVFFDLLKGPLKTNDHLIIEQNNGAAVVSLNYREHARLSSGFLPLLVSTLTARIAPIPELKAGLLGELPASEAKTLLLKYDRGEPSLRRIAETARWLRRKEPQVSAQASVATNLQAARVPTL